MARKRPKEWSSQYLNQQFSAMRWLARQGLTPPEIRECRWGMVDESSRTITIKTKIFHLKYTRGTNMLLKDESEKEIKLSLKDSGQEQFFIKSRISCAWMFTAHPPKTWRKEGSREALFPVDEVEKVLQGLPLKSPSGLTILQLFANIEISNLNITKAKTKELTSKAQEADISYEPGQND